MGRETKILLALLGLLVGVFLGVVSMKLFVPRPPAGVGPDVHADIATTEAQALVDPPDFSGPPPQATALTTGSPPRSLDPRPENDPYAGRSSRFGGSPPAAETPSDPFVNRASFETLEPPPHQPAADLLPPAQGIMPPAQDPEPPGEIAALGPPGEPSHSPPRGGAAGDVYLAQPGDSWWALAERSYGDGRFYRALFAWNRMLDPRVSLAPGTRLEIPAAAKLGAAWPALLPRN